MKKTYYKINRFLFQVLKKFLPDPPSAPEGIEIATVRGMNQILNHLIASFCLGFATGIILNLIKDAGMAQKIIAVPEGLSLVSGRYSTMELLLFLLCSGYFALMPFIRYLYKRLQVTGRLYGYCTGFMLYVMLQMVSTVKGYAIILAVLISAVLCTLPLYLFKYKHIELPRKLAIITYITFAFMTLGGSALKILGQLPYICVIAGVVTHIGNIDGAAVVVDLINIAVYFMFLFLAYDKMRSYARRKVSREFEWMVTFAAFYTVAIIVTKIDNILVLVMC